MKGGRPQVNFDIFCQSCFSKMTSGSIVVSLRLPLKRCQFRFSQCKDTVTPKIVKTDSRSFFCRPRQLNKLYYSNELNSTLSRSRHEVRESFVSMSLLFIVFANFLLKNNKLVISLLRQVARECWTFLRIMWNYPGMAVVSGSYIFFFIIGLVCEKGVVENVVPCHDNAVWYNGNSPLVLFPQNQDKKAQTFLSKSFSHQ